MRRFIGRREELSTLEYAFKKRVASLIVIKGRRRIGKSRLIREFARGHQSAFFIGSPPNEATTDQSQKENFCHQIEEKFGVTCPKFERWSQIFKKLAELIEENRTQILVLDEISWIGSKDPEFLGELKTAWDQYFSLMPKIPQFVLIICGSVSSWIEKNILSSTGFVGRLSTILDLKELPVTDCVKFWDSQEGRASPHEIFKILSVTGGIPKYLEEVVETDSALENINRLCLNRSGFLFSEFDRIFEDLFSDKSGLYKQILMLLAQKTMTLTDLLAALDVPSTGYYIDYVDDLIKAGFISRDYTWDLKTGKTSKLSKIRLSDNYIRFYLKVILPHKEQILEKRLDASNIAMRDFFQSNMGLQFENLVLNNLNTICEHLQLPLSDIQRTGPFFQQPTTRAQGCQIDTLIQTYDKTLYLVEVKFSKNPLGKNVKDQVQQKIDRLVVPKGFSIKPILIHVNGISDGMYTDRFFSKIFDFKELLKDV